MRRIRTEFAGTGLPAYADSGIHVSANIGGAEIYVNDSYRPASKTLTFKVKVK
ncbi:MAG: hypothetical protein IKF42_08520 [Mogibacterium sp.]|nr:hypothetical protein [Mogibacterium sp.]